MLTGWELLADHVLGRHRDVARWAPVKECVNVDIGRRPSADL